MSGIPPHVLAQPPPQFAVSEVQTPAYVVDLSLLKKNLELLSQVQAAAGCKILLAQKGFAMWSTYPLVREYLHGCCASGLNEALLAHREFGREVHVYCPAYKEEEMRQIIPIAGHISFNSLAQWKKFRPMLDAAKGHRPSPGLRVNPELSTVEVALYDPCSPGCRLGTRSIELNDADLDGLEGLHFHALCEQDSDVLERVLESVEQRFPRFLQQVKWVNMGGGHHITKPDYDMERLVRIVKSFRERYDVEVYLEPGEAIGLNTGYLIVSVLDIVGHGEQTAILDTSATCHMPDVLEMPYRPRIFGAGEPGEFSYSYKLGGTSCLAGDVIGEYSFPQPLQIGDQLVFADMAHYTMVKTTTFNGVPHPDIAIYDPEQGGTRVVRRFGYEDFRNRLS
jgi:carboxynorspermidine decarboxylase